MEKIKWFEKVTNEVHKNYKRVEEASKQYPAQKRQLDWSYSKKKLASS